MKTILIAITLMLGSSIFAQSNSEVAIGKIWEVDVMEYNNNNEVVDHWKTNSACTWVFDLANDSITFTEYSLPNRIIIKQTTEYVQFNKLDDDAAILSIKGKDGNNYNAMFWTDFSMVVYEFSDGYIIMTPSED
tara:strand:+ start:159 stop:560 length:402 start_codon:yes stop_codon:yes gene_type:complete